VNAVGAIVAQKVSRRGIRYRFHVIDSPGINAFALPGGQIFVTTGMMNFVQSEAELAAVLGHEMAHVDLRHCIERYQYEIHLRKAGAGEAGAVVEVAHRLTTCAPALVRRSLRKWVGQAFSLSAGRRPEQDAATDATVLRARASWHSTEAHPDRPQGRPLAG